MDIIHLVRHGESLGNVEPARFRRGDPPLTPRGCEQAARVAEELRHSGICAVFSSPLRRAVETAEVIAASAGLETQGTSGFHEVDMGRLSNPETAEARVERDAIFSAWLAGDYRQGFPGGEDFAAVMRRVRAALGAVVQSVGADARVAVVSHRMAIAAAAALCQPAGAAVKPGGCPNCSITTLRWEDTGLWHLVAWGALGLGGASPRGDG